MKAEKQKRYTLEEAKLELNKEECGRYGHDYQVMVASGKNEPAFIYCVRCGVQWDIKQTPHETQGDHPLP